MTRSRAKPPAALSGRQVAELLELRRGADRVELKLTLPQADRRSTEGQAPAPS